jgi:hypothetical protein
MMAVLLALAVSSLLLSSCGTPYQPMKSGTGFADEQIAPDKFVISFQGNGNDSAEKVGDFALLRAAQVTLSHGFDYFAALDVTNTSSARPYIERQRFYSAYPPNMGLPPPTVGGYDPYRFGYIVEYEQPRIYFRPGTRFVIQCFKARPDRPFTYNAAALEQELRQKYNLAETLPTGRAARLTRADPQTPHEFLEKCPSL